MNSEHPPNTGGARQLRLVVTVDDYDEAVHFYRDVLGLPEQASFAAEGGFVTILEAGVATLELTDGPHAAYIDRVEVGRRVAPKFRVAFEVADSSEASGRLVEAAPNSSRRRCGRRGTRRMPGFPPPGGCS